MKILYPKFPVSNINRILKDISEGRGDLTKQIQLRSKDEVGEIVQLFNIVMGNLQSMIREVMGNSKKLTTFSDEFLIIFKEIDDNSHETSSIANNGASANKRYGADKRID